MDVPADRHDLAVFTAWLRDAWVGEIDSEPVADDLEPAALAARWFTRGQWPTIAAEIAATERELPAAPAVWIPDGTFPASYEQVRRDQFSRYWFPDGGLPPTAA